MKMKKNLVIFFVICCSVSLPCVHADELDSQDYFEQCVSLLRQVRFCAQQNFEYFLERDMLLARSGPQCCGAYNKFYESCASNFTAFEADMLLIRWLKDSCGVPTATPSKPPPPPSSSTGPTPIVTWGAPTFRMSTFEPPEIPLPKISFKGFLRGCTYGDGETSHTWVGTIENTIKVGCVLRREKGIACDAGVEPFDTVAEICYMFYDRKQSSEQDGVVRVWPRFVDSSDSSQP
jgi:hypothetical protein